MRKLSIKGELSEKQISDLIGFGSLIAGRKSPFKNEAERVKCYLKHETELIEIYSRRHPGERPELWWKHSAPAMRKVIGVAAWISTAPAKVKIYPIIETTAQFLLRTESFLPHEEEKLIKRAAEDSEWQEHEIASSKELVAMGHNAEYPVPKGKEQKQLSRPAPKGQP